MMLDDGFPGGNFDAVHACYVDPDNAEDMATFEMQQFQKESFDKKFLDTCVGKSECDVTYKYTEFASKPKQEQRLN